MWIVSGGQTGVDRAALDAAVSKEIPCRGWCPKGRIAEDGVIPDRYMLKQTPSRCYRQRTMWNVRDSDATLALTKGQPSGGTAYTIECAKALSKPCLVFDADKQANVDIIVHWIKNNSVRVLNIAGPRESTFPGIYEKAFKILSAIFDRL